MNNKFNRFITSLEAHGMLGKELVTYYKQLLGLKWLDDYSSSQAEGADLRKEGSNLVQDKIKEIQRALFGNDSSYFQHFESKINLSFVRNDFAKMNMYFKNLESIKEILVDSNNKDLYTPLKEKIKGKIKKNLDDSEKKTDEIDFSDAQKLLKFFESYKNGQGSPFLGKDHDEQVEKAHSDFLESLKSKADQKLIWKQPSEENAQEDAEKIYKILSNLQDCL